MRQRWVFRACLLGMVALSVAACGGRNANANRVLKDVNVIDESNLNDIMLTVGDPNEAVAYFRKALANDPQRVDLKRGLATSLVRAGKSIEAVGFWAQVVASPEASLDDRVALADAQVRSNQWPQAEATLASIPPTHETFERYRLEAMVADSKRNWKKADSFYEIAAGLTTQPSGILNNWGFSKLTRGEAASAEKLFIQSLTYDPTNFTTKNNLVLARAAQKKYDLPVITMTQTEKAELLYTIALAAVKQGNVAVGRRLLQEAVETHPQYFEAAANSLAALGG